MKTSAYQVYSADFDQAHLEEERLLTLYDHYDEEFGLMDFPL